MDSSQQLNNRKFFIPATQKQRKAGCAFLVGILAVFGLFWLAAVDMIDLGMWFGLCGFKQRYQLPCPTCGFTTAAIAFAKGRILESFRIQPAGAFVCCLLVAGGFLAFITAAFGVYLKSVSQFVRQISIKYVILAIAVIVSGGWMVTFLRALAAKR